MFYQLHLYSYLQVHHNTLQSRILQSPQLTNITAAEYFQQMGELGTITVERLSALYRQAYAYASERGICILDTKFEAGIPFVLADEVLTPDSSRFTTKADLESALTEGRDPFFLDKQWVREWGQRVPTPFGTTGIHTLDPTNLEHLAFVDKLEVPVEVINDTAKRYQQIFAMLTGVSLSTYQRKWINL